MSEMMMFVPKKTKLTYNQFIGRKLRKRREQLGLTQTKVAKKILVTFQQVQKYEKGINGLSTERVRSLYTALKIPKVHSGFLIWKYNKKSKGRYFSNVEKAIKLFKSEANAQNIMDLIPMIDKIKKEEEAKDE